MKINPVKKYTPGYPTREETLKNPELLKNLPKRWKGLLVSSSIISAMLLAGCKDVNSPKDIVDKLIPKPQPTGLIMGLIVMEHYSLTDEEAIEIILDEFSKSGLDFDVVHTDNVVADVPVNIKIDNESNEYEYSILNSEINVDGINRDLNISFEYISEDDFVNWTKDVRFLYADQRGHFLDDFLKDKCLNTKEGELVLALYHKSDYDLGVIEEELREQVRDFIDMLKTQGVI